MPCWTKTRRTKRSSNKSVHHFIQVFVFLVIFLSNIFYYYIRHKIRWTKNSSEQKFCHPVEFFSLLADEFLFYFKVFKILPIGCDRTPTARKNKQASMTWTAIFTCLPLLLLTVATFRSWMFYTVHWVVCFIV